MLCLPVFISVEVVVAPPSLYLQYVIDKLPSSVAVAGQNCYKAEKGAFTGEIRFQSTVEYHSMHDYCSIVLKCC